MNRLNAVLNDFHDAILTQDNAHAISHLKPNPRITPQAQIAIYIGGYHIRLTSAIRTDYPALFNILGEETFNVLARDYIEANPSADFNLDRYPHGFANFVAAQQIPPFARNVARFESTIAQVFMLPDSDALDATRLTSLAPNAFANLVLMTRTACQLLALEFDVDTYITTTHANPQMPTPPMQPTHLCLVRHENEVKRHPLSPAEYHLLGHIFGGLCIDEALDATITHDPNSEPEIAAKLESWFAKWLKSGFFRDFTTK